MTKEKKANKYRNDGNDSAYDDGELLSLFMDKVRFMVKYWSEREATDLEKCEGVAFSILNIIDGTSLELPPFDIVSAEDGTVINAGCMLHETFYPIDGNKS